MKFHTHIHLDQVRVKFLFCKKKKKKKKDKKHLLCKLQGPIIYFDLMFFHFILGISFGLNQFFLNLDIRGCFCCLHDVLFFCYIFSPFFIISILRQSLTSIVQSKIEKNISHIIFALYLKELLQFEENYSNICIIFKKINQTTTKAHHFSIAETISKTHHGPNRINTYISNMRPNTCSCI